jgi:hypothetical protein
MSDHIQAPGKRREADDLMPPASEVLLPPIGEAVLVQFEDFRCMAFRDREGKWRDCFHKDELQGSVKMIIRLH